MAVYDRHYRPYDGTLLPERWRFLVIPRYAYKDVFASRIFLGFYLLCFLPPIVGSLMIYLHHNLEALQIMGISSAADLIEIGPRFFEWFTWCQSILLYLVVLIVGPSLISTDLADNALPLYLARPFSRPEYLLGKFTVLGLLGASITLIPLSLMYLLQSSLEGGTWLANNLAILVGITLWPIVWIALTGLMALAFSAWMRWRPVATGLLVAVYLVSWGLSSIVNLLFHTRVGDLLGLPKLVVSILSNIFRGGGEGPHVIFSWIVLLLIALACLLLLRSKVKAYEVIR